DDDPYPLAEVSDWPDADQEAVDRAMLDAVAQHVRRTTALALELGDPVGDPSDAISDDPVLASHELSAMAPIADADRYRLLTTPGVSQRVRRLGEMVADIDQLLEFRLRCS
ncbi:MAG: hypothetical protein WCI22_08485, partial [Actinomycetota bacterium]